MLRRCLLVAFGILAPFHGAQAQEVRLAASHPSNGAAQVLPTSSLHLRFTDALDAKSLHAISLQTNGKDGVSEVPVQRATDLTNASITIAPKDFLQPERDYRLIGGHGLRAKNGSPVAPFTIRFRTGKRTSRVAKGLTFSAERFDDARSMTSIVFGPDRRLYAASAFGEIACWSTDSRGRPGRRRTIYQDPSKSRQFIDLEWDPTATANRLLLWVSYAERLRPNKSDPRRFFTGTIARLRIEGDKVVEQRVFVTGLPHGREVQGGHQTLPHQPNGLCFKDGKLYQTVGSTSSSGGPPNWGVREQRFSACVLEIDYRRIGDKPIDVFPGNKSFDPNAKTAPVRLFATGVRNAIELIAHSNGRLYTAVNMNDRGKRRDGVPDDPDIPGDQNALIKHITPDHESLLIIERDRHYGFPNPSLGNYVLNGGNPTAKVDPFEIPDYPVGTQPEARFAPELMYPIWQWGGTSPDGMIEYRPRTVHPLQSAILCCFYSAGDIAVLVLGEDGLPVRVDKLRGPSGKLRFAGPLDITQDRKTGNLYVADFGKQATFGKDGSLVWLRAVE